MGRPPRNPELVRFDAAGYGSAIYVLAISGDVVKVGRACAATRRLHHLYQTLRKSGQTISRFEVIDVPFDALHSSEAACLQELRKVAKRFGRSREYFTGIDYDTALAVVRSTLAESV